MVLDDLYGLVASGRADEALEALYDFVLDASMGGRFRDVDDWVERLDVGLLDTNLLVGLLSVTRQARTEGRLENGEALVQRVLVRLEELAPDRVERLVGNLI